MTARELFDSAAQTTEDLLRLAKTGSPDAVNQLLTICRNYLMRIANSELDSDLRVKVAPSDLVQQSLFEAQAHLAKFEGESEAEILAWTRRILLNNLINIREHYQTRKLDLKREVPMELMADPAGFKDGGGLTSSPIRRLIDGERKVAMEQALSNLSAEYREVLTLRNKEGCSFEEIGRRMNRSGEAARQLWSRAIESLKELLKPHLTHDSSRR